MKQRLSYLVVSVSLLFASFHAQAASDDCESYVRRVTASKIDVLPCAELRRMLQTLPSERGCSGAAARRMSGVALELRERELLVCSIAKPANIDLPHGAASATPPTSSARAVKPRGSSPAVVGIRAKVDTSGKATVTLASATTPPNVAALIADSKSFTEKASTSYEEVQRRCQEASPCPPELEGEARELDRVRTLAMGLYLRVAARWGTDEALREASGFVGIATAGNDPKQLLALLEKVQSQGGDLKAIMSVVDVLEGAKSTEARERLVRGIRAGQFGGLDNVLRELERPDVDIQHLEQVLRQLRPEQMQRLHGLVGNVRQRRETQRALQNRPMIVIMSPKPGEACTGASNMLHAVEEVITSLSAVRNPLYVEPEKYARAVKWIKCKCKDHGQDSSCGTAPDAQIAGVSIEEASCQAVLSIETSELGGRGTAKAELEILLPAEMNLRGASLTHTVPAEFPTGCDERGVSAQLQAANRLVTAIADRFNYLAGLPRFQAASETVVVPAQLSDVHIEAALALSEKLAPQRGKGLRILGDCGREEFKQGLRAVLDANKSVVGNLETPALDAPILNIAPAGNSGCRLTLRYPNDGPEILSVQGNVSEHPWQAAGGGAGEALVKYYGQQEPERKFNWKATRSFVLSGLPQLSDSKSRNNSIGWTLAGMDVALLASGIGFLWGSISERNAHSDSGSETRLNRSNTFQEIGWASLGAVLAERLITGTLYGFGYLDPHDM